MYPKSPHVSAPDGAVTLIYKMGREKWLERFLDVDGTRSFKLVMKNDPWQDLYIQRDGRAVEVSPLDSQPTLATDLILLPLDWLPFYHSQHHSPSRSGNSLSRPTFRKMDAAPISQLSAEWT